MGVVLLLLWCVCFFTLLYGFDLVLLGGVWVFGLHVTLPFVLYSLRVLICDL